MFVVFKSQESVDMIDDFYSGGGIWGKFKRGAKLVFCCKKHKWEEKMLTKTEKPRKITVSQAPERVAWVAQDKERGQ